MKTSGSQSDNRGVIVGRMCAAFFICLTTGCTSMRFTTTLPPSGNRDLALGNVKVNVAKVSPNISFTGRGPFGDPIPYTTAAMPQFTREKMMTTAQQQYPKIFSDSQTALPLDVAINGRFSQDCDLFALACLSLFTLPTPRFHYVGDYTVRVRAADEDQGLILDQSIPFKREDLEWISIYTPLGLIPIPGHTDLPRSSYFMDPGPEERAKQHWLDNASCVEAITKAVQQGDPVKMQAAARWSSQRIEMFTVAGQPIWCKRTPYASKVPADIIPDVILGEIYLEEPAGQTQPAETVQLAKSSDRGDWQPTPQYLWRTKVLSRASAVIEKGKPVRAEVAEVKEIPLAEFLEIQPGDMAKGPEYVRWRTRILLQAKTRTLPSLLGKQTTSHLQDLLIAAEQAALNSSHEADLAKNRAQQTVEKGGDPAKDREWSLVFNEHLAVLNAIAAALKEELSNRVR